MSEAEIPAPIDAATVVVARDSSAGIEALMLRRTSKVHFGGMWVFPGGRLDPEDRAGARDAMDVFRLAAIREAEEEAGIDLSDAELVHFSHWLPPPIRPIRYSTHFFIVHAPDSLADIAIDEYEISEHEWMTAADALRRRHDGEIEMVTPTFVTLDWLRRHATVSQALSDIAEPIAYHTHITKTDGGQVAFYKGDVAYESLDVQAPGPRRRCNMLDGGWWWEEHDGNGIGPWPKPVDF